MEDTVIYSAEKIREIRSRCSDLLRVMEERAERIQDISHKALVKSGCFESSTLSMQEALLLQMIGQYKIQLDHLAVAADLYDSCTSSVCQEAELVAEKGGVWH